MNTNDVKAGDRITKILAGGGFETSSIAEIEHVTNDTIYLKDCDGDYDRESVYAYDLATGRACTNYIPGFSARLILLEE